MSQIEFYPKKLVTRKWAAPKSRKIKRWSSKPSRPLPVQPRKPVVVLKPLDHYIAVQKTISPTIVQPVKKSSDRSQNFFIRLSQVNGLGVFDPQSAQENLKSVKLKITDRFDLAQKKVLTDQEKAIFLGLLKKDSSWLSFHFLPLENRQAILQEIGFTKKEIFIFTREETESWTPGRRLAMVYRQEGELSASNGDWKKAEGLFWKATRSEPQNPFHALILEWIKQERIFLLNGELSGLKSGLMNDEKNTIPGLEKQIRELSSEANFYLNRSREGIETALKQNESLQQAGRFEEAYRGWQKLGEEYESALKFFPDKKLSENDFRFLARIYKGALESSLKLPSSYGEKQIVRLSDLALAQVVGLVEKALTEAPLSLESQSQFLLLEASALKLKSRFREAIQTFKRADALSSSSASSLKSFQDELSTKKIKIELELALLEQQQKAKPALLFDLRFVSKKSVLLGQKVFLLKSLGEAVPVSLAGEKEKTDLRFESLTIRLNFILDQEKKGGTDKEKFQKAPLDLLKNALVFKAIPQSTKSKVDFKDSFYPLFESLSVEKRKEIFEALFSSPSSEELTIRSAKESVLKMVQAQTLTAEKLQSSSLSQDEKKSVLIRDEKGGMKIGFGKSFEELGNPEKLKLLVSLDRLGALSFHQEMARKSVGVLAIADQVKWLFHSAQVDLLEGRLSSAKLKLRDLKEKSGNRPELFQIREQARAILRLLGAQELSDLKEKVFSIEAQRVSHLDFHDLRGDHFQTERTKKEIRLIEAAELLLRMGEIDTLEEFFEKRSSKVSALVQAKSLLWKTEFWRNPVIRKEWSVKVDVEKIADGKLIQIKGGTLEIDSSLRQLNRSFEVEIGKEGGSLQTAAHRLVAGGKGMVLKNILYTFPPSKNSYRVKIVQGVPVNLTEISHEKVDFEVKTAGDERGRLVGKKVDYEHPEAFDFVLDYQAGQLSEIDEDQPFNALLALYQRDGVSKTDNQESRRRNLIDLVETFRDRHASYEVAGEFAKELFSKELGEVRKKFGPQEELNVRQEVENRRHKIEQKLQRQIDKQKEETPDLYRKLYGENGLTAELFKKRVEQIMEVERATRLQAKLFHHLNELFKSQNNLASIQGDLEKKLTKEYSDPKVRDIYFREESLRLVQAKWGWETYRDMLDPLNEWDNLQDASLDAALDDLIVGVVTLPFTMGGGMLVRSGLRKLPLCLRVLAQEGIASQAMEAGVWLTGSLFEGTLLTGFSSGIQGTSFDLSTVGYNTLLSIAFRVGGKFWGSFARVLGMGEEVAGVPMLRTAFQEINFLGHTLTAATIDVHSKLGLELGKQLLGRMDETEKEPFTYAEHYEAALARMVGFHYGSKAFKTAFSVVSPNFARMEEISLERVHRVKGEIDRIYQEKLSRFDPILMKEESFRQEVYRSVLENNLRHLVQEELKSPSGEKTQPTVTDSQIFSTPPTVQGEAEKAFVKNLPPTVTTERDLNDKKVSLLDLQNVSRDRLTDLDRKIFSELWSKLSADQKKVLLLVFLKAPLNLYPDEEWALEVLQKEGWVEKVQTDFLIKGNLLNFYLREVSELSKWTPDLLGVSSVPDISGSRKSIRTDVKILTPDAYESKIGKEGVQALKEGKSSAWMTLDHDHEKLVIRTLVPEKDLINDKLNGKVRLVRQEREIAGFFKTPFRLFDLPVERNIGSEKNPPFTRQEWVRSLNDAVERHLEKIEKLDGSFSPEEKSFFRKQFQLNERDIHRVDHLTGGNRFLVQSLLETLFDPNGAGLSIKEYLRAERPSPQSVKNLYDSILEFAPRFRFALLLNEGLSQLSSDQRSLLISIATEKATAGSLENNPSLVSLEQGGWVEKRASHYRVKGDLLRYFLAGKNETFYSVLNGLGMMRGIVDLFLPPTESLLDLGKLFVVNPLKRGAETDQNRAPFKVLTR